MKILITGGAGYIGTHTSAEFPNTGCDIVVDNFSNSRPAALNRVREIIGKDFTFYQANLLDKKAFSENQIDAIIHFTRLKAVGESVSLPLWYYENNITGTLRLCEVMRKKLIR